MNKRERERERERATNNVECGWKEKEWDFQREVRE